MTAETRELLRRSLLKLLHRAKTTGLAQQSLHDSAHILLPELQPQQTRAMLDILTNDGLLARHDLGGALPRWIITGAGIAHLVQLGLVE